MDPNLASELIPWPSEDIPDDATLYLRVHPNNLDRQGKPTAGAFRNLPDKHVDGMSTDWSKYSTPEETLRRGRDSADYSIIRLGVNHVRAIPDQVVKHTPVNEPPDERNRAHTEVFGPKNPETRALYYRICRRVALA